VAFLLTVACTKSVTCFESGEHTLRHVPTFIVNNTANGIVGCANLPKKAENQKIKKNMIILILSEGLNQL